MKLIIQIPCLNEAETIGRTLDDLPRQVEGFTTVEWLVVDDGSEDDTVKIAKQHGAHHVVRHLSHRGLASAFMTGLQSALGLGADVIVTTDADNQYNAADIASLVRPIAEGRAEFVIGARDISCLKHFSATKKLLHMLGNWVVRSASGTNIPDAPSGFRAMSRHAAQQLMVFSEYTYTLETIIQAGHKNMAVTSVPIRTNEELRPSRLISSLTSYVGNSVGTIIRIFIIYRPLRFFGTIGALVFGAGFLIGLRFLYYYVSGEGDGHVQSLILASILLGMGFQTLLVALIADLLAANRKLLEDIRYMVKGLS